MDDNRFDKILRSKLEDYHHPVVDHNALDALHQQAAVLPTAWYSRYRKELAIASGIAILSLMYFLGYLFLTRTMRLNDEQRNTIYHQKSEIEQLKDELNRLQLLLPDTVEVIRVRAESSTLIPELMQRISLLEESNQQWKEFITNGRIRQYQIEDAGLIETDALSDFSVTTHPLFVNETNRPQSEKNKQVSVMHKNSLDAKSIRAIEKHYRHGLGIKIGPAVDFFGSRYSLGNGQISFNGGVLADFIVSPSLALETGVKYSERDYAIRYEELPAASNLPGVDDQLGSLEGAEVDYRLLEVPLTLKYRYPLSLRNHWTAGIGYSSLIFLNEDFEYTYAFDSPSINPTSIVSTVSTNDVKVYAGTINFSLGISHTLKNKKIVETSLFYNHGIGTQGVEGTRAQYFGLRGTYWFTVR
jgi:hypothetical protein